MPRTKGQYWQTSLAFIVVLLTCCTIFAYTWGNSFFNIEGYLVTTDETGTGKVYTPDCFDCDLVIKLRYNGTIAPTYRDTILPDFSYIMNKIDLGDDLQFKDIYILLPETTTINTYSCNPYNSTLPNNSIITDSNCTIISTPTITNYAWRSLSQLSSFRIYKEQYFYIDIKFQRSPSLEPRATDVIPSIFGIQFKELAWMNSSYPYGVELNFAETKNLFWDNETVNFRIDSSDWMFKPHNSSILVSNSSCKNGGSEITSQIWNITQNSTGHMTGFNLMFTVYNLTNLTNRTYCMYLDTQSKTRSSYDSMVTNPSAINFTGVSYRDLGMNCTKEYQTGSDGLGIICGFRTAGNNKFYDMVYSSISGEPQLLFLNGTNQNFGENQNAKVCNKLESGPLYIRVECNSTQDQTYRSIFNFYPYWIDQELNRVVSWGNQSTAYNLINRFGSDDATDILFYQSNGQRQNSTNPPNEWLVTNQNLTYITHSNFNNSNKDVIYVWRSGDQITSFRRYYAFNLNIYLTNFNSTGNLNYGNNTIRIKLLDRGSGTQYGNIEGEQEKLKYDNPLTPTIGKTYHYTAPAYSQNSTSNTTAGSSISHNLKWTGINLTGGGYIFSWINGYWTSLYDSGDLESSTIQYKPLTYTYYSNWSGTDTNNTATAEKEALNLDWYAEPNSKYLVMGYLEANCSGASIQTNVRVRRPDDIRFYFADRTNSAGTEKMPFFFADIYQASGAGENTKYNWTFAPSGAGKSMVHASSLVAVRLDTLNISDYNYSYIGTEQTNVDTVFGDDTGDTVSINITPSIAGLYMVYGSATVESDNTSAQVQMKLNISGEYVPRNNMAEIRDVNTAEENALGMLALRWFPASVTQTIKMHIASQSVTSLADWKNRSLIALRLSNNFEFYNFTNKTQATTTSTSYVNHTSVHVNNDNLGIYLLMGGTSLSGSSTAYLYSANMTNSKSVFFNWKPINAADIMSVVFVMNNLSMSNSYSSISYKSSSASGTATINSTELIALRIYETNINKSYINYNNVISNSTISISNVTVRINVSYYNNSASVSNANTNPSIYLEMYNGTAWEEIGSFGITTAGIYTKLITSNSILSGWLTPSNRDIRIKGAYFDSVPLKSDEINYTDIWVTIGEEAALIDDDWVAFNSSVCNITWTECWSNATKTVNSSVGALIRWTIYANDTSDNWNQSLVYNYTTTAGGMNIYSFNVSDNMFCSDNGQRYSSFTKNVKDSFNSSDFSARSSSLNRFLFDIIIVSDRSTDSSIYYRRCSDSGNMIDSISRSLSLSKAVYDNFVFYDSGRKTAVIFRSKADFMSFFDKARYAMIFSKKPSDLLILSDARSRSLLFYRLPVEQMSIRDSSTDLLSLLRRSFDSVTVQDYDSRNIVFVRRSADSLSEIDKASYSRIVARSISDLISLLDYDSRNLNLYRIAIDSLASQDTSLRTFYGIRRAGSSLLTGDSTMKLLGKTVYDSLILFDGEQRSLLLTRNSSDAVQFIDGIIRQSTFGRSMFDYFILYDNGRRTLVVSRLTQEQIQILDKADKYYNVIKMAADRMTFSDFLASQRTMARTTFSLLSLSDSRTRTAFINRYGQSTIIINDRQTRISYLFRNISDFLNFSDQRSRQKSLFVNKYDAFLVDDSVSRTLVINLEAAESVNVFEQLAGWILCFFGHTCTTSQTTTVIVESVPSGGGTLVYKYIPILSNATQWLQLPEEINLTSKGGDYFLETITFLNFMPWEMNLSVHFESFFMTDANTWAHQLDEDMKYSNETIHMRPGTPDKPSETLSNVEIHIPEQVWPYLYRFWIVSENINTQENRRTLVTIDTRDFDLLMKKINDALSVQYELANPIFGIKSIRLYDILAFIIFVSILVIGYYFTRKLYKQPVAHTQPAQQQP